MTTRSGPFSLRQHLIRGALGSLVLKISTTLLMLIMAVVLARVLGVEGFGIYAFCLSVIQILTVPAMMGGELFLVREVAAYRSRGAFPYLRGVLIHTRRAGLAASMLLVLSGAAIGMGRWAAGPMQGPFIIALPLIPLLAMLQLQGAALRGLRHIILGQMAQALRPFLVIASVCVLFWISDGKLRPVDAILIQVACTGILVAALYAALKGLMPGEVSMAPPAYETSRWMKSMLPFIFVSSMQVLSKETSVVMLGLMQEPADVALFRVAQRGALLIPFGLTAVNMAIGPTVSELFAKGDKQRLQRLISRSMIAIMGFSLPLTLFLVLGGKWLIPLVFGRDYAHAYMPLVILCGGQLVNACMGSVGLILNMGGLERITARGVAIATLIGICLNLVLIPYWGTAGAALATTASLVAWNVLLAFWVYRETGIVTLMRPKRSG